MSVYIQGVEMPKDKAVSLVICSSGNVYYDHLEFAGKAIPAVDAAEVKHGHWVTEEEAIEKDDYSLRDTCSVCGHCDWDCTESENFNYCPNCGAKMDDVYQPPICGPGEEDGDA